MPRPSFRSLPRSLRNKSAIALIIFAISLLSAMGIRLPSQIPLDSAPAEHFITGDYRVVDGDTIKIGDTRIRMYGIDAPEKNQPCYTASREKWMCGQVAKERLTLLLQQGPVKCAPHDQDRYGRTVAICYAGVMDVNREMVKEGYAVAYRQYSQEYIPAEDEARAAKLGIWQGRFMMPQEWRKNHRNKQ